MIKSKCACNGYSLASLSLTTMVAVAVKFLTLIIKIKTQQKDVQKSDKVL